MKIFTLSTLIRPQSQPNLFVLSIFIFYFAAPLSIYSYNQDSGFLKLAILALISSIVIFISNIFFTNISFTNTKKVFNRSPVNSSTLTWSVLGIFFLFAIITIFTASSIPIISALKGNSISELSDSREQFLKGRVGIYSILVYLNAILTSTFMPYILVLNFMMKKRVKILILISFFAYSLLFLSKIFFLKWALPLASFYSSNSNYKSTKIKTLTIILISVILIGFNIFISRFGNVLSTDQKLFDDVGYYFSSSFTRELNQGSGLKFLVWRAIAVPIFTASDSITVFDRNYNNSFFYGATNGTLATLLSQERIRFERVVFAYQYRSGLEGGTKSSNSVFFIESYINFGIAGVVIFSIIASWLLVNFGYSSNPALSSITPLIAFSLFGGGLLGLVFGNGIVLFLICLICFSRPIPYCRTIGCRGDIKFRLESAGSH